MLFSISYKQWLHVCEMINDGHQCVLTLHHRAMSMNAVISTGHNRGTEPSNAGGHGLGEDKVAIKTDWGAVQPRKIERKKDRKKKKNRKWERHESEASFKLNVLTLSENCVIHPFPSVSHTLNHPDTHYIHFIRQNVRSVLIWMSSSCSGTRQRDSWIY